MGRDGREYGAQAEAQSLLGQSSDIGASLFMPIVQRQRKDSIWVWSWVVVYLASIGAGILTFLNRNPNFVTQISPSYLGDAAHCPVQQPSARRSLLGFRASEEGGDPGSVDEFFSLSLLWLLGSVVGALVVGVVFVLLVSRNPKLLVGLAIAVQVGLPLLFFTGAALQGQALPALPLLVVAGLLLLVFWLWREQLQLVVQLLGVSGKGLTENLGLVGAILGIQLGVLALVAPLLITFVAAVTNGHVAFNSERASADACVDSDGKDVMCCMWELDAHVYPVIAFASFALLWTSFIGNEVKTFTVSGTIAQWYFAPVAGTQKKSEGRIGKTLWAAMGPSFGSLCFGALILTITSMLKSALEQLRKNAEKNIFFCCLWYIAKYLITIVELVTKFATVRLAITGEGFWDATCNVADLLKRNFLDTFGVWWFPPMILQMSAMVLSLVWSMAIYFFSSAAWKDLHQGVGYAIMLSVISFVLTWIVLSFFISLLLNVVDAVYICFAMDRDARTCSRLDVHQVYTKLPSVGPIVENPDGAYAYAAPTRPVAP